jgi:hypothetical protein
MTPDLATRKRPRWFSPRGAVFWILAPAVVIAATFAVLMFWPGLTYDWRSSSRQLGVYRARLSHLENPGIRGDLFRLYAKQFAVQKCWDPDQYWEPDRARFRGELDSGSVTLTVCDNIFLVVWKDQNPGVSVSASP